MASTGIRSTARRIRPWALDLASAVRPRNISQALGWLLASFMVPLLLGAVALLEGQWRGEQRMVQNQLTALVQALVRSVDSEFEHGRAQLEVLAVSSLIDAGDWAQLSRFSEEVAQRRPGSVITLVDASGQALINTAVAWGQPLPNLWRLADEGGTKLWEGRPLPLSAQRLTQQVFTLGRPVYSDLYYGINFGQPRLAMAIPVVRGGEVRYALSLSMSPSRMDELIRSAVNAPGLRAVLVDRRGLVVATNEAASSRLGDRAMPIRMPPGASAGHYEIRTRDGTTVRGAYAVSANNGFVMRASLPLQGAFWPVRGTFTGWVVLVLAALLTSVVLATLMGQRLARPLRELAQGARKGERPSEAFASGIAEINALAQALRAGADAERQRVEEHVLRVMAQKEQALVKQSELRLKRVLDQLFVFVGVLDLDGLLVEGNSIPLRRAGIQSRDVIGKPFWDCHWWVHDPAVAQRVREAVQQAARGETVRLDIEGRFEGGALLMVDLQLAPLRDQDDRITNVIASGVDVQARVAALRQLERSQASALDSARRLDASNRLLQATMEAAPVGIAVADPQCRLLQINRAGAALLGIPGGADLDAAAAAVRAWRHGPVAGEAVPMAPHEWPLQRAMAERRAVTRIMDIAPADGAVRRRTVLMSAAPVLDAADAVIAGVLVQVDITKRVEAETALRRADRQKDEFLATLAHELRNPLAPIRTAAELIRRSESPNPTVQRAQAIIERQVLHLSRLVDDLLDISRISFGTIQLRQETVDLAAVAESARDSVAAPIHAAGLTLEQWTPLEPVLVRGDPTRLAQCVLNLLSNAIKFSRAGDHVALRVAQEGPMAVVEVSDTGSGIQPANLERIFELFVQEQPSGLGGSTGMGIGLALTKRLIELHGGTVRAASEGPGRGSSFRIELPAVAAPARAGQAALAAAPQDGEGVRLLVVDDNRDAADTLAEMLSMSGFGVTTEYSGEGAVRAVERAAPDAVLLDIGLPDIDGYEACRRIRRLDIARQPVLIALTGWGQDQDRDRATVAGFNAHVTKPAEPERIIAMVHDLVKRNAGGLRQDGSPG
ncbi:ATP-binding protein [Ramlibacter sp.]|uniref:ATP-binding protein n=1 Tax=Ramlibacter sp. TaxID=1917967 RepID=UPI002CAF8273|nr:ATP-binding protein [Ramlibacter sp.]HWI84052.1 ATP-binding protein [Ramlibacter sp.]